MDLCAPSIVIEGDPTEDTAPKPLLDSFHDFPPLQEESESHLTAHETGLPFKRARSEDHSEVEDSLRKRQKEAHSFDMHLISFTHPSGSGNLPLTE